MIISIFDHKDSVFVVKIAVRDGLEQSGSRGTDVRKNFIITTKGAVRVQVTNLPIRTSLLGVGVSLLVTVPKV